MNFDHSHYVSCLRWKQGEYQAVSRLRAATRTMFTPLIEVPDIAYDFQEGKKPKTIDEHLNPIAKRIHEKWGRNFCFVDLQLINPDKRMEKGIHPVNFVFDKLRERKCCAIPVTGLYREKAYQKEIKTILAKDKFGLCLRISIEEAAKNLFSKEVKSLLSGLNAVVDNCDFILDLGAPNFVPLNGFSKLIQVIVSKIPDLKKWRTFSIIGTSFPKSLGGIKRGVTTIPRYEWQIYKLLIGRLIEEKLRLPTFGDYVISHPDAGIPDIDWRVVKPLVKIRYTMEDKWYIVKGKNYRDYGYGQYKKLSETILNSPYYNGPAFSWGDNYIYNCANGGKTGNLGIWVCVDTNHHIKKIIHDIASFYDS